MARIHNPPKSGPQRRLCRLARRRLAWRARGSPDAPEARPGQLCISRQPAVTRFPRPIKIHPQRTDNGVLRGHSPPRANMVLDPCEAVWCSCPPPLVRNSSASLANSPHRHLYDDATCMLAALLAYFLRMCRASSLFACLPSSLPDPYAKKPLANT